MHPHPSRIHIMRAYRRACLARRPWKSRALMHYKAYLAEYRAAKADVLAGNIGTPCDLAQCRLCREPYRARVD